jgi:hypothetical protein
MIVGTEERVFSAGQSVIVSADMPVVGRIVQASRSKPYLAVAVELEMIILREVAVQLGSVRAPRPSETRTLFAEDTEAATLDCASRLMRLLDHVRTAWRRVAITCGPGQSCNRLAAAIAILRAEYRSRVPVKRLAAALRNFPHSEMRSGILSTASSLPRLSNLER